ncbi:MAG TPA: helical backbone metal receptor [Planctomycetota bacterium]|nr:helical backbone metal receptor [Planctomycetota bacterium]
MIRVVDALGDAITLAAPARRVVPLIPSVTETLFALGVGDRVVGCTTFCIHPADGLAAVPRIGGTKDPDVDRIAALAPDLVLANREENRREDVERLRAVAPTHVSYPRDVDGLLEYLDQLGALLAAAPAAGRLRGEIAAAREAHARDGAAPLRVVYLIWRKPWMAAAGDTFVDAMLRETGFVNVLADAPGRYPPFDLARCAELKVDLVLLSSEPFPFDAEHRPEIAAAAGLPLERIQCVSGEAFSWFGVRTPHAFAEARRVRAAAGA